MGTTERTIPVGGLVSSTGSSTVGSSLLPSSTGMVSPSSVLWAKAARGDIAVTGAYSLNAKYIIHTVGPVWTDGLHHEFEILEDCYRKSLQKALELKCESIAFPLISTGVYGFPKDKALQIAVSVFSQFLTENEIEIILVVFDKRSFQLSSQIVGDIDSYIDANYVRESHRKEYPVRKIGRAHV